LPGVELYAFVYRTYSPQLGRWLQRDPLGYVDGMNLYEYVRSGPLTWIDPLGRARNLGHKLWEAFFGVLEIGPLDVWDAAYGQDADIAQQFAKELAEEKGTSEDEKRGITNAVRHATWQALLTMKHGPDSAREVGDLHEVGNEETTDSQIDQQNNQVGRDIGVETITHAEVEEAVEKALDNGELITDPGDPRLPGNDAPTSEGSDDCADDGQSDNSYDSAESDSDTSPDPDVSSEY
jgi:uncharacterized protein RhaS with RHS repeats